MQRLPRRALLGFLACLLAVATIAAAQGDDPFDVQAELLAPSESAEAPRFVLRVGVPSQHKLYADMLTVRALGDARLEAADVPAPTLKYDPLSLGEREVYLEDFEAIWRVVETGASPLRVEVSWQGCDPTVCFFPQTKVFEMPLEGASPPAENASETPSETAPPATTGDLSETFALLEDFKVAGTAAGYLSTDDFVAFLTAAEEGRSTAAGLARLMEGAGFLTTLVLILLGGVLLNLTPCVLPMIPVNLAIIGAGTQAGSRARGFGLGALYGAGVAAAYGALGLVVLVTEATFGTVNSEPWFNFSVAALFVVLALAMFGLFQIDFTRFRPGAGARRATLGLAAVFAMGALAAILAGACVAPVVIAVLVLAGNLAAEGNPAGYALPFLLGLGMALPWPFAGAGLSLLPKPGRWMTAVKIGFGLFILAMAAYYGWQGWRLLPARATAQEAQEIERLQAERVAEGGWTTSLTEALETARREDRPVFIDFWATWCKNCLAMDRTTFRDPEAVEALENYVKVKVQTERPGEPPARDLLARFDAKGLPTYVVLHPAATAR